jgi:protein-arginine kinase activator protein McsA
VQKGCYASVVTKKDSYDTIIKQMQGNNEHMNKAVEESQRKIEKIMTIRKDGETQ